MNSTVVQGDLGVVRRLLPYLWEFRGRVLLALLFLVSAKLANITVPLVMKRIVDGLSGPQAIVAVPMAMLAAYGLLRLSSTVFNELRDVVFVKVAQRAMRRVALEVFHHLHALSLRFHLERQTGGLSRAIERGTAGIEFLLTFSLFNIVPTIVEMALVTAILWTLYDFSFAAVKVGSRSSPVLARNAATVSSRRKGAISSSPRRHFQTIAGRTGSPLWRSQITSVSV